MNRRQFVSTTAQGLAGMLVVAGLPLRAEDEPALIYLSPIKSNGALSKCQAEVWYVQDGADQVVVTGANAWRAQAITQGLSRTQIWVGDVGQWQSSGGAYLKLPSHFANGQVIADALEQARLLELFGAKYVAEWDTWGPRFKNGLSGGTRMMLRYTPA